MNALALSVVVVFGSTAAAVIGLFCVRKLIDHKTLQSHHEVAGYLLSIIGTLYAVLLGLIVVDVQSKYQQARMMAETEASAAADIYHLSAGLQPAMREKIQSELLSYVNTAVNEEWGQHTGQAKRRTGDSLRHLWTIIAGYEPKTNGETTMMQELITQLDQLSDSRRFRIVNTQSSVSPVLWAVLIIGGILTVAFTYFFGVDNLKSQVLMTVLLGVTLSLNVLLVALYSNPYFGDLSISPDGFKYDQKLFSEAPLPVEREKSTP